MAKMRVLLLLVLIVTLAGCDSVWNSGRYQIVTVNLPVLSAHSMDVAVLLDTHTGETWRLDYRYVDNTLGSGLMWRKIPSADKRWWQQIWSGSEAVPPELTDSRTVIERRQTKDGRILEKLSDGTIREANSPPPANTIPQESAPPRAMNAQAEQGGDDHDKFAIPPGLPDGTVALGDGTYRLPNGKVVRKKQ